MINHKAPSRISYWFVLLCLSSASFVALFDRTAISLALTSIAKDMHTSLEDVQLVLSLYLVGVIATVLFFGRLGDTKGKSNVFLIGTTVFTVAALCSALAPTAHILYGVRLVQGIGGGAAVATAQGILTEVSPVNERGAALGLYTVAGGIGMIVSNSAGGFIISNFSWKYLFLIDFIVGLFALIVGFHLLPKGNGTKGKVDYLGAGLLAGSIVIIFLSLLEGGKKGYTSFPVLAGFLLGVVLIVGFIVVEKKTKSPLLDFSLYQKPVFTISVVCVITRYLVSSGTYIFIPIYLQDVRKFSASQSGIILLMLPISLSIISPISGRLSDRFGASLISLLGLLMMIVSLILLFFLHTTTPIWLIVLCMITMGIGSGMFSPSNSDLMMGAAPSDRLGAASSSNGFAKNLGSILGTSLFPRLLYAFMGMKVGHSVSGYLDGKPEVFLSSLQIVYLISLVILLISAGFALWRLLLMRSQKLKKLTPSS